MLAIKHCWQFGCADSKCETNAPILQRARKELQGEHDNYYHSKRTHCRF